MKAQTPLFSLVADRRPWVEANFKETDLTHVTVGQKATVVLDMHPDITWEAEVESISPATGAEFAILPPQNASGNWVKVVQRLPVKLRLIERPGEPPLRAGMTAYVSIDTKRQRSSRRFSAAWPRRRSRNDSLHPEEAAKAAVSKDGGKLTFGFPACARETELELGERSTAARSPPPRAPCSSARARRA